MTEEQIKQYYTNLEKYAQGEWTSQMWYDYCVSVLGQLMLEHQDVFTRLKNR